LSGEIKNKLTFSLCRPKTTTLHFDAIKRNQTGLSKQPLQANELTSNDFC